MELHTLVQGMRGHLRDITDKAIICKATIAIFNSPVDKERDERLANMGFILTRRR